MPSPEPHPPRSVLLALLLSGLLAAPGCTGDGPSGDDDATAGDDDTADDDDAGDDDTATEIQQDPIVFTVANDTGATFYFNWLEWWSDDINAILSCAGNAGDGWTSCLFGLPFNGLACTPELAGQECHSEVDSGPAVYVLPAGRSLDILWSGRLWTGNTDHCSEGVCFEEGATFEGSYSVSVNLWGQMECMQEPCADPGEDGGVVWGAFVLGDDTTWHLEFELPSEEAGLTITLD